MRDSRTLRVAAESPVEHEDADVNIVGEEIPIWFIRDQHAHLLPSAPVSTKFGRQSTEGYTHDSR